MHCLYVAFEDLGWTIQWPTTNRKTQSDFWCTMRLLLWLIICASGRMCICVAPDLQHVMVAGKRISSVAMDTRKSRTKSKWTTEQLSPLISCNVTHICLVAEEIGDLSPLVSHWANKGIEGTTEIWTQWDQEIPDCHLFALTLLAIRQSAPGIYYKLKEGSKIDILVVLVLSVTLPNASSYQRKSP